MGDLFPWRPYRELEKGNRNANGSFAEMAQKGPMSDQ
jgi:hypothetical protein